LKEVSYLYNETDKLYILIIPNSQKARIRLPLL